MSEAADVYVLDTSAWLTLIEDESGADVVQDLLEKARAGEIVIVVSFMSYMEAYLLSLAVLHPEPKAWVGVKQARLPQQSESFWFSMYCLITDSGAPPQVTMKYARCHKTGFRYTRARCLANSFLSNLDETVLRLLTSLLRATVGGALINRCM